MQVYPRTVSPNLSTCQLTHQSRSTIDLDHACRQHEGYRSVFEAQGYIVNELPPLPQAADGVFVEDTAVIIGGNAVITRPGSPARSIESLSTEAFLAEKYEVHRMNSGFLDGGDVLRINNRFYVGQSTRTNEEGYAEFCRIVNRLGFEARRVGVENCLHLKTAATFAGNDSAGKPVLVANQNCINTELFDGVDLLTIDVNEPNAANVLRLKDKLLVAVGSPRTKEKLLSRGFTLVELDISEFQKAEAGLTCMSLVDEKRTPSN